MHPYQIRQLKVLIWKLPWLAWICIKVSVGTKKPYTEIFKMKMYITSHKNENYNILKLFKYYIIYFKNYVTNIHPSKFTYKVNTAQTGRINTGWLEVTKSNSTNSCLYRRLLLCAFRHCFYIYSIFCILLKNKRDTI